MKTAELQLTPVTSIDEEKGKVKFCKLIKLNLSIVQLLKTNQCGYFN
jgi:hypothetical protein